MAKVGKFCVITDTVIQSAYSHLKIAEYAIKGGADMIQLRDKSMPTDELIETAFRIKKICLKYDVTLIINDRVDVALVSGADGVHLGKDDLPVKDARKILGNSRLIGATAHSLEEAKKAERDGADYLGYGHIFPTATKIKSDKPKGIIELENVIKKTNIPIIAIGGINKRNLTSVLHSLVYGIAVCGAIVNSEQPQQAAEYFSDKIFNYLYL